MDFVTMHSVFFLSYLVYMGVEKLFINLETVDNLEPAVVDTQIDVELK